jgi:signal transduction histidine kinase
MSDGNTLTFSQTLFIYTLFIIHITMLVFIAGVYGFAHRFLGERFYIPIAVGWIANAGYLAFETYLLFIKTNEWFGSALELFTAALGLVSMPFFHRAVQISSRRKKQIYPWYGPFLIAMLPIAIYLSAAAWTWMTMTQLSPWLFAAISLPAVIYSLLVLILVSYRFYRIFSEDDFGISSRLLYGSWGMYAILQCFYPFKLFQEFQSIMLIIFLIAFSLKVLSSVALLNVLKDAYSAREAQTHETSVLADVGNLAAGLHHDIANPLSIVDSEIELLSQKRHTDDIVQQALKKIRKPLRLVHAAIQFVDLVRQDPEEVAKAFKRTSVNATLSFATSIFKKKYPNSQLRIVIDDNKPYYVRAHQDLLADAFVNIFKNALEAHATLLTVRVRRSHTVEGQTEFSFVNNGRLLTEEEQRNCLKPGWSSKKPSETRANIGMGLYMSSRIVRMHRGNFQINNCEDQSGVIVSISLPVAKRTREN